MSRAPYPQIPEVKASRYELARQVASQTEDAIIKDLMRSDREKDARMVEMRGVKITELEMVMIR